MAKESSELALSLESQAKKGDFAGVIAQARKNANLVRSNSNASFIFGIACAMTGDLKAAAAAFNDTLSSDANHIAALGALARVRILSGDTVGAQQLIDRLASEANAKPEAAENLIDAYLQCGRAEAAFQAAFVAAEKFGDERFLVRLSEAAIRTRRKEFGIDAAARAEIRFGETPAVISVAGPAALLNGDTKRLSDKVAKLGALPPDRAAAIYDAWTSMLMAGDFLRVARNSADLAANAATTPARLRLVSDLCLADRDVAGAETAARRALTLQTDDAAATVLLARCRIIAGDIDQAKKLLLEAIEADPSSAAAFDNLTQIDARAVTESMADDLERRVETKSLSPDDEAKAMLALARRYEAIGEYARAFDRIIAAKMIIADAAKASGRGYDPARTEAAFETIKRHFPAPIEVGRENSDQKPVFVVGMPRSGTSLVEQILASHATVCGEGELPGMQIILDDFLSRASQSSAERALRDYAERWSSEYCGAISAEAAASPMFVDKHPLNFWCVGLIRALFPGVRVISVRRSAVDTCLSILRVRFFASYVFANRIEDVAHYYAAHVRIMAHWRALFGDTLYEIDYDALTTAPEIEVRNMLDYCGLEFDPACLKFHENRREVVTHSAAQVREPINRLAAERRARYGDALKPLEDALKRYGV